MKSPIITMITGRTPENPVLLDEHRSHLVLETRLSTDPELREFLIAGVVSREVSGPFDHESDRKSTEFANVVKIDSVLKGETYQTKYLPIGSPEVGKTIKQMSKQTSKEYKKFIKAVANSFFPEQLA